MSKLWKTEYNESRFKHTLDLIPFKKYSKFTVLDAGSGQGHFAEYLLKHFPNAEITCMDFDDENLMICHEKGFEVIYADFNNYFKIKEKYDLVISMEVVEHLINPEYYLKQLKKKCDVLIISTPNFSNWRRRIHILLGKVPEDHLIIHGHIRLLNVKEFSKLLKKSKWDVLDKLDLTAIDSLFPYSYKITKRDFGYIRTLFWNNLFTDVQIKVCA